MEINVFDQDKNVVVININDVIIIKRVADRLSYITEDGLFYGAVNAKEDAELHAPLGFTPNDKHSLINTNLIERIENGEVYVLGKKYQISRRKYANLRRYLKKKKNLPVIEE